MDLFNLAAKLFLDSKGFEDGVKDAEKGGRNLAQKLEKSFGKIQKFAKAAFTVFTASKLSQAIWSLANDVAGLGDTIDKSSQKLGISRKAYQQWEYILSQNGASIDSMTMALKTMNSAMQADGDSAKEVQDAFKKLGVSEAMIKSMSPEDQFEYLVHQFQKMPASAEKTALALQLFGRSGTELLPLLNQSASSVVEMQQHMEDLGLIMGDDAVDASVEFGDSLDDLKRTFTAFRNVIGARLLPTFTKAFQKMTGYVAKLRKSFDNNGILGVFKTIGNDIQNAITWDNIKKVGEKIWEHIRNGFNGVVDWTKQLVLGEKYTPDASWGDVGRDIWGAIKSEFKSIGPRLKEFLLGKDYRPDSTWVDVGKGIWDKIKSAFTSIGTKLKELLLGKDYRPDATWEQVGTDIWERIKSKFTSIGTKLKEYLLGKDYKPDATWVDVGKDIWDAIKSAFKNIGSRLKEFLLGKDYKVDSTWGDVGADIWNNITGEFKSIGAKLKELLLGKDYRPDSTWAQVGTDIWTNITGSFTSIGNKLKQLILGENYTVDSTWAQVGAEIWSDITGAFTSVGSKLKQLILGDDYSVDSTWGQVGSEIWGDITGAFTSIGAKLKQIILGEDYTVDSTWVQVGSDIWGKIQGGFTKIKLKIGELLGLANKDGSPTSDEDATWASIGGAIISKIQAGITTVKVKIAEKLGIANRSGEPLEPEGTSWLAIGGAIIGKIWGGITGFVAAAKGWLAEKLGIKGEADDEASWKGIGSGILDKIKNGMANIKVSLARKLGLVDDSGNPTETAGVSWSTIGQRVLEKIKGGLTSTAISFSTILGLTDEQGNPLEKWSSIGQELIGKLFEKVEDGQLLDKLLTWTENKVGTISAFITGALDATTEWLSHSENVTKFVTFLTDVLTTVVSHLSTIISEVVPVLVSVLTDPEFIKGITDLIAAIADGLATILGNPDVWNGVVQILGALAKGILDVVFSDPRITALVAVITAGKAGLFSGGTPAATGSTVVPNSGAGSNYVTPMWFRFARGVGTGLLGSSMGEAIGQSESESNAWGTAAGVGAYINPFLGAGILALDALVGGHTANDEAVQKYFATGTTHKGRPLYWASDWRGGHFTLQDVPSDTGAVRDDWDLEDATYQYQERLQKLMSEGLESGDVADALYEADAYGTKPGNIFSLYKASADLNDGFLAMLNENGELYIEYIANIEDWLTEAEKSVQEYNKATEEAATAQEEPAESAATLSGALDGASQSASLFGQALSSFKMPDIFGGGYFADGSNAKGLWEVPYDDYVARLHRGERVLTASQARDYDRGGNDTGAIVQAVKEAVGELVGSLKIELNNKTVGKVIGDSTSKRVHKNIDLANGRLAYGHGR